MMRKLTAGEALRQRYEITEQEALQLAMMLRAALQVIQPESGEKMGELGERAGYSRQSMYAWAARIIFLVLWMLRKLPTGRPPAAMHAHPMWNFIRAGTMDGDFLQVDQESVRKVA